MDPFVNIVNINSKPNVILSNFKLVFSPLFSYSLAPKLLSSLNRFFSSSNQLVSNFLTEFMVRVDPKNVHCELEENQEHDISSEGVQSSKTFSDRDEFSGTSSDVDECIEENDTLLMIERETSIDLSRYGLRKELDDKDHFDGVVSILSMWDVVEYMQSYLKKEKVYNQFMNSCFGCLLKVNLENWNKRICGQIVHYLLQRRVINSKKKEIWFIIDGNPIRFGMKEFAMVIGLNCEKIPTVEALCDKEKTKDFLDIVLNNNSSLTENDLKEKLKSNRFDA